MVKKLSTCKISHSFCTYTVINLWHGAKYGGRNLKIIGYGTEMHNSESSQTKTVRKYGIAQNKSTL